MGAITQLLVRWGEGDIVARDELMPLVYDELRKLARAHVRREASNLSLEPTALVHEAYVKLVGQDQVKFENRAQFFGLAAQVMRNVLVDQARRRRAAKRWGQQIRVSFTEIDHHAIPSDLDLIALNDALDDLATNRPTHARVVELRFFADLTIEETAIILELSHATVERYWVFARAWLRKRLSV